MSERLTSPEQLDKRIRVIKPRTWITLFLLLVSMFITLILLINKVLTVTERLPCVVTEDVVQIREEVFNLYQESLGKDLYFTIDALDRWYQDMVSGYGQKAYLIVRDMNNSEIAEGMVVNIADARGGVIFLPAEPSSYEEIKALGLNDEDACRLGLSPGLDAWICPVLLLCGEKKTPVMQSGPGWADVILRQVHLGSLMMK